jgi:uncharacterized protein (UPF0218 family)
MFEQKPRLITAVGDVVSMETWSAKVQVHLRVIDHRSLRKPVSPINFGVQRTYRVINPAGVITMDAWHTIRKALRESSESVILVDGEEDLLTLPCIVESPDNAFVIYGQPSQGMVVVTTSPTLKKEMSSLLDHLFREEVPSRQSA